MKILFTLSVAAILFACNGSEPATNASNGEDTLRQQDSIGTKNDTATLAGTWYLLPALPSDTGARETPHLTFNLNERTFTGNSGCNSMSGSFEYTDTSLVFNERIMLTKMACPGYNEQALLSSLLRTRRYQFRDSVLIFLVEETELSRWARKPSKPPVINRT